MLEAVLREIQKNGYLSKNQIAAALGTSPGLVEEALTQLINLGYLKVEDGSSPPAACGQHCAGCLYSRQCARRLPFKTVVLTGKGERLLRQTP